MQNNHRWRTAILSLFLILASLSVWADPRLNDLDQTSQYAMLSGVNAGESLTLNANGKNLLNTVLNDLQMDWRKAGNTSGKVAGQPNFGNLIDGNHQFWSGNFTGSGRNQLLFYYPPDGNWFIGDSNAAGEMQWTYAGNSSAAWNISSGKYKFFVGDFTLSGSSQLIFYDDTNGNWWLGQISAAKQLQWKIVGNTKNPSANFGDLINSQHAFHVGTFAAGGRSQIIFHYSGDSNWFMGSLDAKLNLTWRSLGSSSGFGNLLDGQHLLWTGEFSTKGLSELLFYYKGDGNWWRGSIGATGPIQWSLVGNSKGFGNLMDGAHLIWTGDFLESGKTALMLHYRGDSNWFTGSLGASGQLAWSNVGNTKGFGDVADANHRIWTGHFGGTDTAELLFYSAGDSNWWRGALKQGQLAWNLTSNTRGFGNPLDGNHLIWTGNFVNQAKSDVLIHYAGDGNWWRGQFDKARVDLPTLLDIRTALQGSLRTSTGSVSLTNTVVVSHNYATQHYDRQRLGWNRDEPSLTQTAVKTFKKKAFFQTDDQVYAQPLYVEKLLLPGQSTLRNVLYVVSERGTLYAIDADTNVSYATRSLIPPGETPVPAGDIYDQQNPNIAPVISVTGTPVIDRATDTLYVVVKSKDSKGYHQRLHSVALATLEERLSGPVEIAPTYQGVAFDALANNQRPALLLTKGKVVVGFGSHEDGLNPKNNASWAGWVLAYDAATLSLLNVFNADIQGGSGIWQSGHGIAADESGKILLVTGNSSNTNPDTAGGDLSNSVLALDGQLLLADFFTPSGQTELNKYDWDLGSGGPMILPTQAGQPTNLALTAGKQGYVYLLNRDDLGKFKSPEKPLDKQDLYPGQVINTPGTPKGSDKNTVGMYGGAGFFGGSHGQRIYICGTYGDTVKFPTLNVGQLVSFTLSNAKLIQRTQSQKRVGSCTPFVTSKGTIDGTGVVWMLKRENPLRLMAFSAINLNQVLLDVDAGPWTNSKGTPFIQPTLINGKAYVPSSTGVTVFGN